MIIRMSISQRLLFILSALFLLIIIGLIGSWMYGEHSMKSKIYPGISIDGIRMDYKSKDEAQTLLRQRDEYYADSILTVTYKNAPVATFSGELLGLKRDIDTKIDQAYLVGRSPHFPSRIAQRIGTFTGMSSFSFRTEVKYDQNPINEFLELANDSYSYPAKNALFTFENGKVTSFKEHESGIRLKTESFKDSVHRSIQLFRSDRKSIAVLLEDEPIKPEITLSQINDFGIEELIAEGKSNYTGSIASRVHNLVLAATKFNGVIIPKGEIFSFNTIIGDISARTGYQPAYVIKDGRTVLGDGGGVCQVSTTMFRAAIQSGLPIVERNPHAYRVSYYENDSSAGFDASIYTPSVDLRFTNNTPAAILIQMVHDKDTRTLAFRFYGKKDGRKVEISPSTVWDIAPPPPARYEDDPTLPLGQVRQVDFPAWGAKARFSYKVTSQSGNSMIDTSFYSSYRPWQAVYMKGTAQ